MKRQFFRLASVLLALSAWLWVGVDLCPQDVGINLRGPYRDMGRSLIWGQSGAGGFNSDFVFTPTNPAGNLCIYVRNNNPSSTHTFGFLSFQTADPRAAGFLSNSNTWIPAPVAFWPANTVSNNPSQSSVVSVPTWSIAPAGVIFSILVRFQNAAKLALDFSGGTTLAGSPDTADIWTVETPYPSCGTASSDQSFIFYDSRSINASNVAVMAQSQPYFYGVPIWNLASLKACTVAVNLQNTGGTTPTLNVYFQTGYGQQSVINDLISFAQATTGVSQQVATVNFEVGAATPKLTTAGTLTANTVNNGFGLGDEVVLKYVLGGTSPVYTVNVWGYCH